MPNQIDIDLYEQRDLLDAIQHADIYGDHGWTLEDFEIKDLGEIPISKLHEYDDLSSWVDIEEGEYDELSTDERLDRLNEFRGESWANKARLWLDNGIPPIVVISAPMVSEHEFYLYTQIGDGRGRVNFAHAMGIKTIPAVHMIYRK
jgi:hypothetical protein